MYGLVLEPGRWRAPNVTPEYPKKFFALWHLPDYSHVYLLRPAAGWWRWSFTEYTWREAHHAPDADWSWERITFESPLPEDDPDAEDPYAADVGVLAHWGYRLLLQEGPENWGWTDRIQELQGI